MFIYYPVSYHSSISLDLFKVVLGWAKRAKHASFCYQLLGQMMAIGGRIVFTGLTLTEIRTLQESVRVRPRFVCVLWCGANFGFVFVLVWMR